jgi:predicted peptidase
MQAKWLVLWILCGMAVGANQGDQKMAQNGDPAAATGFINKQLGSDYATDRYVLYVPRDYRPDKAWPLIVFLHGAGERGDDGLIPTEVGIGSAIRRNPDRFPGLVLFPQCPKDAFWDVMLEDLDLMMAHTRRDYSVDARRVYLTGLSMGGYGTWIWGATKADTFAAFMPICGGGNQNDMARLTKDGIGDVFGTLPERVAKLATVPIWAFHGGKDGVVPSVRSQQMVRLVKEAGGKAQYTEYEELNHNSWDAAYAEKKAIKWMFKQKKAKK